MISPVPPRARAAKCATSPGSISPSTHRFMSMAGRTTRLSRAIGPMTPGLSRWRYESVCVVTVSTVGDRPREAGAPLPVTRTYREGHRRSVLGAAGDVEDLAVAIGGLGAGEEGDRVRDVGGHPHPADRRLAGDRGLELLERHPDAFGGGAGHLGLHEARGDRVGGDAEA